jgi:protein-S-isoprenylcysteine O-methyltransferase Ste14
MDFRLAQECISALWIVFALYWLVSALKRKKTKQRESWAQRFRYMLLLIVGSYLLARPEAHYGWLGTCFVPTSESTGWVGVGLTAAGIGVALWARWHLGANWSGVVTLKEGHELVRGGPYRSIRHPIYTGILLALLGTAIVLGEIRGLLGLAIIWGSFYVKARREEAFLAQEFGPRFEEHRSHTGMFLPRFS